MITSDKISIYKLQLLCATVVQAMDKVFADFHVTALPTIFLVLGFTKIYCREKCLLNYVKENLKIFFKPLSHIGPSAT